MAIINSTVKPFAATAYLNGKFVPVTDADLKGKWSIFFFYPADFTFVCPTELGDMADLYPEFQKIGVEVYSVSTDTHFTHKAWHDASDTIKKIKLPDGRRPHRRHHPQLRRDDRGRGPGPPRHLRGRTRTAVIKVAEIHDLGIGRDAKELLRKVKAAQYVATHPGEVCPAKWQEGDATLAPSLDLVGKI
jgi:peroxiredoxin